MATTAPDSQGTGKESMAHQTPLSFLPPTGMLFFTCLHFLTKPELHPFAGGQSWAQPPEPFPSLSPSEYHAQLHPL